MQTFFNQGLQFLQQGIAAILNFVRLVWTWSIGEMTKVLQAPWQSWPLWKQILLVLVAVGVIWALYKVAQELWEVLQRVLSAFVALLGALVRTMPGVALAGLIALGGIWVINHLDPSNIRLPTFQTTSR